MGTNREEFLKGLKFDLNKRTLKNKPANLNNREFTTRTVGRTKEVSRRIAALAAAIGISVTMLLGMTGCGTQIPEKPGTTQGEVDKKEESPEVKAIKSIDSIDKVEYDFIQRYIKAYNEAYGTKYGAYNINLFKNTVDIAKVNGNQVAFTKNNSAQVISELKKIGDVEVSKYKQQIIQLVTLDGVVLGSFNPSGEFVYSGNYQLDLVSDNTYEEPNAEKLGISKKIIKDAVGIIHARGVESEDSIEFRINGYKAACIEDIENNNAAEKGNSGFEMYDE